jgi:hypothetical protein
MEDHKKVISTQILIEVEVEMLKPHFRVNMKVRILDIINIKVNLMEVDEETLEEEEVMEVVVQIIEVDNQIIAQIATTTGNMADNYYQREHDA